MAPQPLPSTEVPHLLRGGQPRPGKGSAEQSHWGQEDMRDFYTRMKKGSGRVYHSPSLQGSCAGRQRTLPGLQAEDRSLPPCLQLSYLSECDTSDPDLGSLGAGMGLAHPYADPEKGRSQNRCYLAVCLNSNAT